MRTIARGLRGAISIAGAAVATACSDPTSPPTSPAGARLTVDLIVPARLATDPELTAHVSAWLTPGRDGTGALREVEAPLRISDQPIQMSIPARSEWATVQSIIVPLAPIDGHAMFAVESPIVRGVQPTIPIVRVGTIRLAESDTIVPGADGALRLHPQLAAGARAGDAPTTRQWILSLTGTTSLLFTVTGPLPAEILVPRDLMPIPTVAGWRVQLTVNDTFGPPQLPQPGGDYDVLVRVSQPFFRTALTSAPASH